MRWSACKWGMDEDWMKAESMTESAWHQDCAKMHGGSTCSANGDCGNPDGSQITGTPNLSFMGYRVTDASGHFVGTTDKAMCPSVGIIQSKVQYGEFNALLIPIPGPVSVFFTIGAGWHHYKFDLSLIDATTSETTVQKIGWNFGGGIMINIKGLTLLF